MSVARRSRGLGRRVRLRLAERYVWWQEPSETLRELPILLRQILRLGTDDDTLPRAGFGASLLSSAPS